MKLFILILFMSSSAFATETNGPKGYPLSWDRLIPLDVSLKLGNFCQDKFPKDTTKSAHCVEAALDSWWNANHPNGD
jgi:hypothetical protein